MINDKSKYPLFRFSRFTDGWSSDLCEDLNINPNEAQWYLGDTAGHIMLDITECIVDPETLGIAYELHFIDKVLYLEIPYQEVIVVMPAGNA